MIPFPASVSELLQALIRIPSVNPAGNPGTDGTGEQACAEYIAGLLRGLGAEAGLRHVLPGRPNVVGRFPSRRAGAPRLLLAPHTDTVSVAGMTIDPFGAERRDGRIYGRGASDTKGSIAAMLWALRETVDLLPDLGWEVWFAGLAGEEAGQQGAIALAEEEPFDFVIAGEPTGMNVVYTHKGNVWLNLTTRGRAVHASQPENGVNAIYSMAEIIAFLRAETLPDLSHHTHPVLGPSTLSVGTIEGGSKTNIVPDCCRLSVDMRIVPGVLESSLFTDLAQTLATRWPGVELEMRQNQPLYTDPAHPVIRQLAAGGAECVGAPWFCDAAVFARKGVPAIAMGPGSIAQAHTEDEWILEADLEGGAARFGEFLRGLRG